MQGLGWGAPVLLRAGLQAALFAMLGQHAAAAVFSLLALQLMCQPLHPCRSCAATSLARACHAGPWCLCSHRRRRHHLAQQSTAQHRPQERAVGVAARASLRLGAGVMVAARLPQRRCLDSLRRLRAMAALLHLSRESSQSVAVAGVSTRAAAPAVARLWPRRRRQHSHPLLRLPRLQTAAGAQCWSCRSASLQQRSTDQWHPLPACRRRPALALPASAPRLLARRAAARLAEHLA